MNQDFKNILLAIQKEYGLNQTELARHLGLNRSYISSIAVGRYPFSDSLAHKLEQEFPKAFGITVDKSEEPETPDMITRMQDQIDSLIRQNGQLLNIIENMTKK